MIQSKQDLKEYLSIEKKKQQVSNNIYIYIQTSKTSRKLFIV